MLESALVHQRDRSQVNARMYQLLVSVMCLLTIAAAQASSIRQLHLDDVSQQSELIFVGEVVNSVASWNPQRSRITTQITFRIDEVIKGSYSEANLQLGFAGGTVGDATMEYEGLRYPIIGESGIYFVETIAKPLVNPLVGWSQGHFLLDAQERVNTYDGKPVSTVQRKIPTTSQGTNQISRGIAQGLQLASQPQNAMSRAEFVQHIKQSIE
ncbi:MAG: hypothetical protein AAF431_17125 [Pseudomonadota bacterium]